MRNRPPRLPAVSASPLTPIALAAAVLLSSPALAQTARWINPAGGGFATPSNWDVGHPPATTDTAAFGPGAAYTVTLSANTNVTNVLVDTGSPTFDLGGFHLHAGIGSGPGNVNLAPAGPATVNVTLRNGTLDLPTLPFNSGIFLGGPSGSTTNFNIGPNASISLNYCTINIGASGGGGGAAHVTLNGSISAVAGQYPDGSVIVNSGSTFLMSAGGLSPLHIRNFGGQFAMAGGTGNVNTVGNTGDFTLSGGASLTTGSFQSSGRFTVSGGARLTCNGIYDLTGDVLVDGGFLAGSDGPHGSPSTLVLRNGGAINPFVGSTVLSGNPLFSVASGCSVTTAVSMQGGVLHVDRGANMPLVTLTIASPATLEVAFDAASLPATPMITCTPNPGTTVGANLAGTLAVQVSHPNNLHIGNQVEVLRVASGHTIQGAFSSLQAPDIGGGRQFQIVQTTQSVFVRVVAGGSTCWTADFDGDGDIGTDADIQAFFACIGGNCCQNCGSADFNGDGDVGTDADIESFFRVLAGGGC